MTIAKLKTYRTPTAVIWFLVCAGAVSVLGRALYSVFSSSLYDLTVLATSAFVAVLVCQHHAKIPFTQINMSAKTIFAFWGIMWLGPEAGLILAAAASIARYVKVLQTEEARLYSVFSDIVATFVSAQVYVAVFAEAARTFPSPVQHGLRVPTAIIFAVSAMVVCQYVLRGSFSLIFRLLEGTGTTRRKFSRSFVLPVPKYLFCLMASLVLFTVFTHFGIEFGLAIIPVAIFANLAHLLHRRTLEQKTKEICEASRLHLATVEALATAIDARDQIGIGHVRRTQVYAVGIGNAMRLNDGMIKALRTGALLHDIGKLAVPDHILNKPAALTPAEHEKTKIHVGVGASILEKVGFDYPVVPTVRYHHERWDGTGYPEGLKGADIPLTARILTVADVYDTLRGARPYRAAVSREEACAYLREHSETQFDPRVVKVFLENLDTFDEEITEAGLSYKFDAETISVHETGEKAIGSNYIEQIKRANREVFSLYELARDFSSSVNLERTLALFTKRIGEFVPYDNCIVYLLNESGESAKAVYVAGTNSKLLKGKTIAVGEGATGYVLKKRKPVERVDPALDFAFSDLEVVSKYVGMASLPLIADDRLLGAVSLYSNELPNYEEEHLRLLETVSRIAADAIYRSQKHDQTESHALTDPLTGLPNARSLQRHFETENARAGRSGSSFQLLMLDLDGFKAVNDTYGHRAGDIMLREIGKVIRGQLRDYDFLARYGGDEFVALIPDTDLQYVTDLCRRIEKAVNEFSMTFGDDEFARVGVSVGSASFPKDGQQLYDLIAVADKEMYKAKAGNRSPQRRFEAEVQAENTNEPAAPADLADDAPVISSRAIN